MIRDFEKDILLKIDLGHRYLQLKEKFSKSGSEIKTIKKSEYLRIFKELDHKVEYGNGGYYGLYREYKNYKFNCQFHIIRNSVFTYIYIYKEGILQRETGLSHYSYMLNFLPYDKELAQKVSKNFGINSIEEMKEYLTGLIGLFDEFVDTYIKEIEAGNVPD